MAGSHGKASAAENPGESALETDGVAAFGHLHNHHRSIMLDCILLVVLASTFTHSDARVADVEATITAQVGVHEPARPFESAVVPT